MFTYAQKNGVGYYYSTLLKSKHAFATRHGGVSENIYTQSLNLARNRGDNDATVLQNLHLFAQAVGMDAARVISLSQVHGTQVLNMTEADAGRGYAKPGNGASDGYITLEKDLPLGVKSADCVPVLLEARDCNGVVLAVGAVHAGWRGTAGGIVRNAVRALCDACGEVEIYAAVGPCIGICCFEVAGDCVDVFLEHCGREVVEKCFMKGQNGKYYGDLVKVNRLLLVSAGVSEAHIDQADICTCCHPELFFSHRYATRHHDGQRGTMLSVICKK